MKRFGCFLIFSEEEAKKKIYSVSTTTYTGFGALISEELSYKVKGSLKSLSSLGLNGELSFSG